jgi:NADPH2:quinone reductase
MKTETMKYICVNQAGGAEVLEVSHTTVPQPDPGQVLIKVAAAGLNRADILQRKGHYPPPPGSSEILGMEIAGEILEVTENCGELRPGDAVCALLTGGGYAQYAVAEAPLCLPRPEGLDNIQAASLPEALFTVWSNLIDIAQLKRGDSVLIHGGSSGIGSAAIQFAKAMGCRVFTTAGSDKKCHFCRSIGADVVINYKAQDFVEVCLSETKGEGINVILDMVGGDYLAGNIELAAVGARIVMIAAIGGNRAALQILPMMHKRLVLTGSTLRSRDREFKSKIAENLKSQVWPLLENGKIKPSIDRVFHLDQVREAHQLMESSQHCGKIILKMN